MQRRSWIEQVYFCLNVCIVQMPDYGNSGKLLARYNFYKRNFNGLHTR
jgi:hypothetical protein